MLNIAWQRYKFKQNVLTLGFTWCILKNGVQIAIIRLGSYENSAFLLYLFF